MGHRGAGPGQAGDSCPQLGGEGPDGTPALALWLRLPALCLGFPSDEGMG